MYIPRGYQAFPEVVPQSASAGSFEPDPRGRGGSVFKPSAEGKKLLDYYLNTYKVPLELRVADPGSHPPSFEAFFQAGGVDQTGYGGSSDPQRRVISVNPRTSSPTVSLIAHEATHAYDPYLPKTHENRQLAERELGPIVYDAAVYGQINDKPKFLREYLARMGPSDTLAAEARAQVGGREALKKLEMADPESKMPYFKDYPLSYADKGIDAAMDLLSIPRGPEQFAPDFFRAAVSGQGSPTPDGKIYSFSGDTVYDYGKDKALKLLDAYLTPGVRPTINNILGSAETYINRLMD